MSETYDDLLELSRFDEVEAVTAGDGDHTAEVVAPHTELVLNLTENGATKQLQLTRHDAEVIIEVLWTVLHPNDHRRSPVQRLWAELDDVMEFLMDVDDPEPEDKARAKALAEAIALISLPFADEPDIDTIKAEAIERWEARQ